jgi:hypothetical protein
MSKTIKMNKTVTKAIVILGKGLIKYWETMHPQPMERIETNPNFSKTGISGSVNNHN